MSRGALVLSAIVCIIAAQNLFVARADEFDAVRQCVQKYVDDEGVPSISVAAIRDNEVAWLEAYGWANRENRVSATTHTPYMLASSSKPITATVVMVACEQGRMHLNQPINEFLVPRIGSRLGDADAITVRDVLMHRSGVPNYSEAYLSSGSYRPEDL